MIPRNATVRLGEITVELDDELGYANHVWADGRGLTAEFRAGEEDVARARSLGYEGSDPEVANAMHREHDLAHHLVAQALGWPGSVVLRLAAEGRDPPYPVGVYPLEERLAFLLQRVSNLGIGGLLAADGAIDDAPAVRRIPVEAPPPLPPARSGAARGRDGT